MKRLFLALRAELNDYDNILLDFSNLLEGRWAVEKNLHATVCFFGDAYSIEELLYRLPPLIEEIEPFELISLGYFERNDILYAKMQSTKLEILQASICSSFSLLNHQPFTTHVTLARVKDIYDKKVFKDMLNSYENKTLGKLNARFELMHSHLEPQGAKYKSIKRFES